MGPCVHQAPAAPLSRRACRVPLGFRVGQPNHPNPGARAGKPTLPPPLAPCAHAVGSGAVSQPTSATRPTPLGTGAGPCGEIFAVRGPPLDSPPMTQARPAGALTVRGSKGGTINGNIKTALTALTDALAELPAEDILFTWFRSGRLVGELHELLEQRHPLKLGEMDRVYENQKWAPRARSGRKRQTAA